MSNPQVQFKKATLAAERKNSDLHVEQGKKCA